MSSCLFECLKEAGLERYYHQIQRHGYETAYSLLYLPPAELQDVGITTDTDRQRFLQLVQIIASFHHGGTLSPRRLVSPQRSRIKSKSVTQRRGTTRKGASSMTNALHLGYQSSDSNYSSEESPPGYIPSPRRRSRSGAGSSTNATFKSRKAEDMEPPVAVLPIRHIHQPRRKVREIPTRTSLRTVQEPIIRTASRSVSMNDNPSVQPSQVSNIEYPMPVVPQPIQSADDSSEITSATKSIRMSAEFLKVQKVMQSKGYNYGLPRESPKNEALDPRSQRRSPARHSPQTNRENTTSLQSRPKITVCVRKRPILQAERQTGGLDVITCNTESGGKEGGLIVHELKHTVDMAEFIQQNVFQFDKVFADSNTNQDIYEGAVKPIVDWIMSHNNRATCFGYGQTGAGKTHTLLGNEDEWGVFFHAARDILSRISSQSNRANRGTRGCTLAISLYEIYCSRIFDLLNNHKRLQALEDSNRQVHIHGLRSVQVQDMNALQEVVRQGLGERSVGVTGANQDSSRSHAIVQLSIKDAKGAEFSRLSFIDLAGSERACDALRDSDKQNRLEGAEINQSLLALKECIRSLDLALAHTPFRQSKLTQVLRDSFIGNSRTCMIANISPSHSSLEHTMNTLRYASRVKELHRKPTFSTPRQRRTRLTTSSARTARTRPFTADPTYSQSKPISSSASKPRSHISRSVSIESGMKIMDCTAAFTGRGRELTRTPPPIVTRSLSDENSHSTSESHELPNESENIRLSSDTSPQGNDVRNLLVTTRRSIFTPEAVAANSTPNKTVERKIKRTSQSKLVLKEVAVSNSNSMSSSTPSNPQETEPIRSSNESPSLPFPCDRPATSNSSDVGNKSHQDSSHSRSVASEHGSPVENNQQGSSQNCSSSKRSPIPSSDNMSHSLPPSCGDAGRRLSIASQSSNDSENSSSARPSATLPESTKNPGLPSPKKFLTYLKGKQSMRTKTVKQQLRKARHRATSENQGSEEDNHSSDHSAASNSSANTISTSRNNLTSNVQQHHQQRILQTDSSANQSSPITAQTPPRLPSPKLDRSAPKRSSRISSRSASPGTGGRTTPDERQSTSSNPSTKIGLTSASELRARLAAAAAALNSHSDSDDGKVYGNEKPVTRGRAVPRVSSSSDKENNDVTKNDDENSKSNKDDHVHKAQSEVIMAHQEHISEILRISIEEERLYHNLRDQWDKGTSFETYTKSLRKLLARKTQSIEALKVQLALYDRVRRAHE